MKWTYSIKNKIRAAMLLFIVLALVLLNNFSERNNSSKINKAIHSIYDDRLIAESYIFRYLNNSHQIIELIDEPSLLGTEKLEEIRNRLANVREINGFFEQTTLTNLEKTDYLELKRLYFEINQAVLDGNLEQAKNIAKETLGILELLSEIQLTEAKNQIQEINRLNSSITLNSHFEIAVLIIIGVWIQGLVFASNTLKGGKPQQDPSLN
ncbi:hypothetical protein [Lunatibacter salilacus]|uniref:hypothetical protein n=1 Tax=Lunatibacter salilacus TaxID=2483804 RepID=UPI00131A8A60|nr:hypothetical protein [Lunatibacter salilacus]